MKTSMLRNALLACGLATCATPALQSRVPLQQACAPGSREYAYESDRAKGVAAVEVGGEALAARLIDLNGATGGWEVLVRMPQGGKGWKVVIDRDTWAVRSKEQVPNP